MAIKYKKVTILNLFREEKRKKILFILICTSLNSWDIADSVHAIDIDQTVRRLMG